MEFLNMFISRETPSEAEMNSTNTSVPDVTTLQPNQNAILQRFNDIQALRYFPVFLFLSIIMIIGTIGNALVLFVYCKKFRKTSSNYFIVAMAIFDLLACLIGLPTELYDLRNSFTFYNSPVCKIFRYTESVVVYGSAIILIEIAIDRYFKICRPLMIIEIYKIKIMCIVAGVAAVFISVPALALFGISRTLTPDNKTKGYDCSIEEQYSKQAFSKIYYYLLGIVFIVTVVLLSALYIRIWIEIKRRKNIVIGDQVNDSPKPEDIPMTTPFTNTKRVRIRYSSEYSDEESATETSFNKSVRPRLQSIAEAVKRFRVSRTTIVLFAVTVAFAISYLPAIVIMICRSIIKDLETKQSLAEQVISKLFSKFYFINNAINPIIYSFLNVSFRRRCVTLIKQLLFCRRKKVMRRPTAYPEKTDSQRSKLSNRGSTNKSTKNEVV